MYVYGYVYVYMCMCAYKYVYIYVWCIYVYIYVCVYVLCLCIYVYMYMFITSVFVYVYLCIWMYIFRHCVCKRAYILFWSYDHVHIEKEKKKISYSNKALMIFHRDASNSLVLGINCLGADLPSLTVLPWDSRFWLKSHSLTVRLKIFTANWYLRKVFPQYSFTDFFTILQTKVVIRIDL